MNLKKFGKVFTNKFVGTGPSSYKKKNLTGRGLTKVEKHWLGGNKENYPFLSSSALSERCCTKVCISSVALKTLSQ